MLMRPSWLAGFDILRINWAHIMWSCFDARVTKSVDKIIIIYFTLRHAILSTLSVGACGGETNHFMSNCRLCTHTKDPHK